MADVVSRQKRSEMMSGIRGKDTKPEQFVRKALHRRGFRYRLHDRKIQGKPDIVLPKHKGLIFVHGCFWHMHDCHLFKWPKTRQDFWHTKLLKNKDNDEMVVSSLLDKGWRVLIVWECALKGKERLDPNHVIDIAEEWIRSDTIFKEIRGSDA